ncbi:MAG: ribokinase [Chloroflexota bacterium]
MPRVVVVGSVNMDLVVRAPRFALAGETILGDAFETIPGGKGSNQAVAARRAGADVAMVGRVGGDEFGSTMRRTLSGEGISVEHVEIMDAEATGVALITVDGTGENTIIVVPGANGHLSPGDIEAAHAEIAAADILLMQLEIPLPAVERAAQLAHERGVTVILNAAPARPLPAHLLSMVDYLVVNETEARLMAGTGSDHASPEEAARNLQALGARNVVVTLGHEGSLLVSDSGATVSAPAFTVHPVDTTAAGDGFVGALAVALAEGAEPADALRRGNAAGALAVTREGAQPSLPTRAEIDEFLTRRTERLQQ